MSINESTIKEVNTVLNDMLTRMSKSKSALKEVVQRSNFSVKCYWCGEVLRYDIQFKENR